LQASHTSVAVTGTGPQTGTITLSGVTTLPATYFSISGGSYVMPAKVYSLFIDTTTDSRNPMLKLDPDGVAGTTHDDAEPLAEGVEDLQVAIGWDGKFGNTIDGYLLDNGSATDEWLGNQGTTEITSSTNGFPGTAASGWGTDDTSFTKNAPRAIRMTLLLRSLNQYAGTPFAVKPSENRGTSSGWNWASVSAGTATVAPKFRQLRMVVAPRAWNMSE
jgi:hypothetical protein